MSSFIVDFRPTHNRHMSNNDTDFIAEFRQNQNRTYCHADFTQMVSLKSRPNSLMVEGSSDNGQDVLHLLSDKQFSKGKITQLLHGSIISLIETLFAGRSMSKITGSIQVSLHTDPDPISVSLDKEYGTFNGLEPELNLKVKSSPPPCDFVNSRFSLENVHGLSYSAVSNITEQERLDTLAHGDHCATGIKQMATIASNSTQNTSILRSLAVDIPSRRDSDEESGYNSNNELSISTSAQPTTISAGFEAAMNIENQNVVLCDDGSPKCTEKELSNSIVSRIGTFPSQESAEIAMDDNCEVEDPCLMIDLSKDNFKENEAKLSDSKCHFSEMTSDAEVQLAARVPEVFEEKTTIEKEHLNTHSVEISRSSADKMNVDCEPTSGSDITDFETDCLSDHIGDNNGIKPYDSLPHPQSMFSKLTTGLLCKLCLERLPDKEAVTSHAIEKHNLFSCSFCFRTFTAKNNLKRHIRLHTGIRPYRCSHCSYSFARRDDLKGHMLRHDYSKPFRCAICKKGYTDRACVKNHMAKEHGSRLMHVCPQCGESFDNDDAFSIHKQSHPELKQYSCKVCFFIGNNNLMTMKHSLIHDHGLFSCKPCNAYFADPFDYTNHVRKHKSNSEFSSYVCCFCKMNLTTYDQFVRHEYSHAQGKSYSCGTCNKQFKSKAAFQEHSITHTNQISQSKEKVPEQSNDVDLFHNSCHFNSQKSAPEEMCTVESLQTEGALNSETMLLSQNLYCRDASACRDLHTCDSEAKDHELNFSSSDVLDLSVKKGTLPVMDSTETITDSKNANRRFTPISELVELNLNRVPRNGYTSEFTSTSFGDKSSRSSSSDTNDSIKCSPFSQHYNQLNYAESNASLYWGNAETFIDSTDSQNRTTVSHGNNSQIARASTPIFPHRAFSRPSSGMQYRKPLQRMSPYSKEKLVDLASKFFAARGPLIPFPKHRAMKTTNNVNIDKRGAYCEQSLPSWPVPAHAMKHDEKSLRKDSLTNEEMYYISRESVEQSPVTALGRQLPTFIKTEPFYDNKAQAQFSAPPNNNCRVPFQDTSMAIRTNKNFDCDICKVIFNSFQELENHSVMIHKKYLCEHCGRDFTARPNRDRHVRYHTGERPYKCDLCDQAFHRGDDLKYHRTTRHPSAQPFSCTRCSATFTWSRDLEKHIRQSKCKV